MAFQPGGRNYPPVRANPWAPVIKPGGRPFQRSTASTTPRIADTHLVVESGTRIDAAAIVRITPTCRSRGRGGGYGLLLLLYAVNVRGVFFLTQKLVPLARDRGRILNVPSGFVRFVFPRKIAYASMHWINGERIEASRDTRKMELQPRGSG